MTMSRILKAVRNGILGFIIFVFVLEIGLRLFGFGNFVIYTPDQSLLWLPEANQHRVTIVGHLPITINAQDFRSAQPLGSKKPGEIRIFAFGDSVTMGWGVGDNSTYSADLERLLNSGQCPDHTFQVVNAGVNAYPNALVIKRLEDVVNDDYHPDAVILAYSYNTNLEPLVNLKGAARERILRGVEIKSWVRRSAIYNFFIEDVFRRAVYYRIRHRLVVGTWNTKDSPVPDVNLYKQELADAWQLCQAKHVPMVLLLLSSKGQADTGQMFIYQTAMLQFAQQNHVPIVNLMGVMKGKDQDAMYMDHVHPTAAGHEVIAEQLYAAFRQIDSYCTTNTAEPAISGQEGH